MVTSDLVETQRIKRGAIPKSKVALVIMGLGSNRPNSIIRKLRAKGYTVIVKRWYDGGLPKPSQVDVVIGHSAGGTRAQLKYKNEGVPVYSLNAPTNLGGSNVTYITNSADPVSTFAGNGDYVQFTNVHSKNRSFSEIENEL